MDHSFPKQPFIDDLLARNAANLQLVEETFAPLERAARTTRPAPGEWCVDQCLQHLTLAFAMYLPRLEQALAKDRGGNAAETFDRSWMARQKMYRTQFDPRSNTKTLAKVLPSDHFYADVYERFAAQKARLAEALEEGRQADLQRRCWVLGFVPVNLGDYLETLVCHDELHIDQAQRALAAYRQSVA